MGTFRLSLFPVNHYHGKVETRSELAVNTRRFGGTRSQRSLRSSELPRMSDTFSKAERSDIMRAVHSTGTGAEKKVELLLRSLRLRYRRHAPDLPGKPDFVLTAQRLALFVHGCFWHAHTGCKSATLPTSNVIYWAQKIGRTNAGTGVFETLCVRPAGVPLSSGNVS